MRGGIFATLYILVALLFFLALGVWLKRHVLNRRPLPTAAQQAGLAVLEAFSSHDKRNAVEEIAVTKEGRKEQAESGDDVSRFAGESLLSPADHRTDGDGADRHS